MKNFTFILFFLTLIQIPAHAEDKFRDMSLSVQETNQQLNTPQTKQNNINGDYYDNGTGFDSSVQLDPNMAKQLKDINTRNASGVDSLGRNTQGNYINQGNTANGRNIYSINGNTAGNAAQGNYLQRKSALPSPSRGANRQGFITRFCDSNYQCDDEQRQQSCERYRRAAVNVQRVLDQTIDCQVNNANYSSGCDGLDAGRLDLLKQYWQDEDESYTILFLPDMVLNSMATCTNMASQGSIQ